MKPTKSQGETGTERVVVMLGSGQAGFLDMLSAKIRMETGGIISRSAMLRAMAVALERSKIDLSKATSESDVTAVLTRKLKA